MPKAKRHKDSYQKQASAILLMQSSCVLLLSIAGWVWFDVAVAYSAFCGGMIALLANFCFAFQLFKPKGAKQAKAIVHACYRGETSKWLVTAGLFYLLLRYTSTDPVPSLLCYCAMQAVGVILLCAVLPLLRKKAS